MSADTPVVTAPAAEASVTEQLWRQFADRLRGFIASQVSSPEAVDDILQEVFLKIHHRSHTIRESERLTSWIFQVTRNTIIDHYRHAPRRRERPSDALDLDTATAPETALPEPVEVARREMAACVRPLLAQLPAPYRQALELVELDGLTQAEAARRVGISVSGMKSRVQRGRARLHGTLRDWCAITLDARGQPLSCVPEEGACGPATPAADGGRCS